MGGRTAEQREAEMKKREQEVGQHCSQILRQVYELEKKFLNELYVMHAHSRATTVKKVLVNNEPTLHFRLQQATSKEKGFDRLSQMHRREVQQEFASDPNLKHLFEFGQEQQEKLQYELGEAVLNVVGDIVLESIIPHLGSESRIAVKLVREKNGSQASVGMGTNQQQVGSTSNKKTPVNYLPLLANPELFNGHGCITLPPNFKGRKAPLGVLETSQSEEEQDWGPRDYAEWFMKLAGFKAPIIC